MKRVIIFFTLFLVSCSEANINWVGCYEGEVEHRIHFVFSDPDYVTKRIEQVQVSVDRNRYYLSFRDKKVFLNNRGKGKIHFSEFPFGGRNPRHDIVLSVDIEGESMEYVLIDKEWDYQTVETISKKEGVLYKAFAKCD